MKFTRICRSLIIRTTGAIVSIGLISFPTTAQAPLDVRVALVIGNSAYAGIAALSNPGNDAQAMADALKQLGFTVVELRNGGKAEMTQAVAKVSEALKGKQGVGMLYYAGHGLQLEWRNYMVPVDAKLSSAADVIAQTVDVNTVLDAFKSAGNRMNILILDACRDNPFAATTSGKGLAQVDAPPGTFLAYATAPGNVAQDGDAKAGNGLYTQYLLEELKKPSTRIEDVFKRVRLNVRQQSQGRQIPWESTSLEDDFYFNTGLKVKVVAVDGQAVQDEFLVEKEAWDKIKDSTKVEDFYAFLLKYPSGFISEQAQFRVAQLQKARTVAVPNRDGVTPVAPDTRRFNLGDETVIEYVNLLTGRRTRATSTVTQADEERAEFNNGQTIWTQAGFLVKDQYGTRSPPTLRTPADMQLGKRWKTAYQNTHPNGVVENSFYNCSVVSYDNVSVPEGKFKAFYVVCHGEARSSTYLSQNEVRTWFDPASLRVLSSEWKFSSKGVVRTHARIESVSFKRKGG
jgi:Caspase domain